MIWTEWDPLEEIIVGVCPPEHFYDNFVKDDRCLPLLNTILKETREDLDNLSSMLEAMGIKVYRPNNLQFHPGIDISTFQIHNPMAIMQMAHVKFHFHQPHSLLESKLQNTLLRRAEVKI